MKQPFRRKPKSFVLSNNDKPRRGGFNPIKAVISGLFALILLGSLVLGAYYALLNAEADQAARDALWESQGAWDATPVPAAPDPNASIEPGASLPPLGNAQALPTPEPPPDVLEHGFAIVPNGYFGPKATVSYFPVEGRNASEVASSIDEQSPATFAGGTAFAWVIPTSYINLQTSTGSGGGFFSGPPAGCEVTPGQQDAIQMNYSVHLPLWEPPDDADPELIEWWNTEFSETLAHEKHHINLYEFVTGRMNGILAAGGPCDSLSIQVTAMWDEAILHNCQYDVEEYGLAAGATLDDCTGMGPGLGPKLLEVIAPAQEHAPPSS